MSVSSSPLLALAGWPAGCLVPRCDASAKLVAAGHYMTESTGHIRGPLTPQRFPTAKGNPRSARPSDTRRRPLPREGPHQALGRGPAAAAGAVAAAGSGGLAASLTSGAGEADGNKTLCCMALTFLRVSHRRGGQRGEQHMSKKQSNKNQ